DVATGSGTIADDVAALGAQLDVAAGGGIIAVLAGDNFTECDVIPGQQLYQPIGMQKAIGIQIRLSVALAAGSVNTNSGIITECLGIFDGSRAGVHVNVVLCGYQLDGAEVRTLVRVEPAIVVRIIPVCIINEISNGRMIDTTYQRDFICTDQTAVCLIASRNDINRLTRLAVLYGRAARMHIKQALRRAQLGNIKGAVNIRNNIILFTAQLVQIKAAGAGKLQ